MVSPQEYRLFVEQVWDYYARAQRDLPWRHAEPNGTFDPYKIWVSEIMLQQTQVSRVVPKFQEFIKKFPTIHDLSKASLSEVFEVWNGLGYNRRAKFLHDAAIILRSQAVPATLEELVKLPGIGKNTAAAILVYSYNEPYTFIETNIRTVYIHHFFGDIENVDDKHLLPIITETMDQENPREWFWALMDYGTHIKASVGNASRRSKHHVVQSKFEGSRRQLRARVLKTLLIKPVSKKELQQILPDERLDSVLQDLVAEGFVRVASKRYSIA